MSFWSKTRKSASRTKQSALAKVGSSEETIDAGFNFEKERFQQYYAQIKIVEENSERMMKAMREFTAAQNALFDSVAQVFTSDSPLHGAALDARGAASEIDTARVQFEQSIDCNILKPIVRYKMQFKEMKHRMESWETKKLDLDRYRHDVKGYQKAGKDLKEKAATEKLELANHNFGMLNEEIQQDLASLYTDRLSFFQPIFSTLAVCGLEFYIASTGAVSKTASELGRIDRTAALTHSFVITPKEDSAAYRVSSKSFAPKDSLTLRGSADAQRVQPSLATFQQESSSNLNEEKSTAIQKYEPQQSATPFDSLPSPVLSKTDNFPWPPKSLPDLPMPPPPPMETLPSL